MDKKLFLITGPSAVGKTSILNSLLARNPNLEKIITYTTRQPRPEEKDNQDYHFVDRETFQKMIDQNEFFEYNYVYDNYYGNSKIDLDKIWSKNKQAIATKDIQGVLKINKSLPQAISIFLAPESIDQIKKRLLKRNLNAEDIKNRLKQAENELKQAELYDFVVINQENKQNQTIAEIEKILLD